MMFMPKQFVMRLLKKRLKNNEQQMKIPMSVSLFGSDIRECDQWIPVIKHHMDSMIIAVKESEFETLLSRYSVISMNANRPIKISEKIRIFGIALN